jgi:hypothetical protein
MTMTPRGRASAQIVVLAGVFLLLFLLYPPALAFAELAAREIRYLWWVVLLVALAGWLIWGVSRKPK